MSSQGSTFSWGGSFGSLTGISFQSAQAEMVDVSGSGATLRSSGDGQAVIRKFACLAVDPGGVQIKFIDGGGFSDDQVGTEDGLSVSIGGFGGGGMAVLESFSVEASVGDLVRGTANFRFTGT
jgi:hypothetical protein